MQGHTPPQISHSPSTDDREPLTISDLLVYRLPPCLPPAVLPTTTPSTPAHELNLQQASHSSAASSPEHLTDVEEDDEEAEQVAPEAATGDPATTASLSPHATLLRQTGVIRENCEFPINVAFDRSVRKGGRESPYHLKITVGDAPQSGVNERAGPFCNNAADAFLVTSRLGNLRVHVHPLGVQIWLLGIDSQGDPSWLEVTDPENTRHPDAAMSKYRLNIFHGRGVPSWVTKGTIATYRTRFRSR
ncbi:hypothetical protein BKA62DRAFT_680134 [Auriculariales sp. MPI-PUGE-AT-0066]|nr:hypothetical protein BKA62DRAFT_680134 [Auriculariales sp. MPI-PUGE-AT-0066]